MAALPPSDAHPWSGRLISDFSVSKATAEALPPTALSRLEARLQLEAALESRSPRLLARKPTLAGQPCDFYALHQAVLRLGGYRRVSAWGSGARAESGAGGQRARRRPPRPFCAACRGAVGVRRGRGAPRRAAAPRLASLLIFFAPSVPLPRRAD